MARSSYIYIVLDSNTVVAAFTVKWECQAWLQRHPSGGRRVDRVPDGQLALPTVTWSEQEFLEA